MRSLLSLSCKALISLLAYCATAQAGTPEQWPAAPKFNELHTPYGTLTVSYSEYIYEARLQLDGIAVQPEISGMLNIHYAFDMPGRQAALVSVSHGNEDCPVVYHWIILNTEGYSVSPGFGSCSEHIRVKANVKKLTLETPSQGTPAAVDTYVYDGKTVVQK